MTTIKKTTGSTGYRCGPWAAVAARSIVLGALALGAPLGACMTAPDEPDVEITAEPLLANNGIQLNGIQLNGIQLNGIQLNGIQLNGIQLNGIQLNGIQLNGTKLGGTLNGRWVEGTGLVGATLVGLLSSGATLPLRVDLITALPAPNQDLLAHVVSYKSGTTWTPLCGYDAAGAAIATIPLAGQWDLRQGVPGGGSWSAVAGAFTFACRGAALAKCVELGYKPWAVKNGVALRNHHQACTRMVRADYCGDGRGNTFNGWRVDVYDNLGIQAPTAGLTGFQFEARWAPSGAVCMTAARALDLIVSTDPPACVAARTTDTCANSDFSGGVLIKTQFDPWGINVVLADAYQRYPAARSDLSAAIGLIDQALAYLAVTPPRPRDAAGKVGQAITHLASTLPDKLPTSFGLPLMRRYASLTRSSLVNEIAKAELRIPGSTALNNAKKNLVDGDALLAVEDYQNANTRYKNGLGNL